MRHVLIILCDDVGFFFGCVLQDLLQNLGKVLFCRIDLLLKLLSDSRLGIHVGLVLVHQYVHIHVVSLNSVSDDLLEGAPLIFLLLLKILEACCILKHFCRVCVPILFQLNLLSFIERANLFILIGNHLADPISQGVIAVALLESHRSKFLSKLAQSLGKLSLPRNLVVVIRPSTAAVVLEIIFKLVTVLDVTLNLVDLSKNLVSKRQQSDLPMLASLAILDIMNHKAAVLTCCE